MGPTYQDVLDAPEHMVAELLAGELVLSPRPASSHGATILRLGAQLVPPFECAEGGPGSWTFSAKPSLHLNGDVIVPDVAGWRLSTMHELRNDVAAIPTRPDWICEVLSPSTEKVDRTVKLHIYRREGVAHVWLVDPRRRTVEVLRREPTGWAAVATFRDQERVRAEPFEAIEFAVGKLWTKIAP